MSHFRTLFKDKSAVEVREGAERVVALIHDGKIKKSDLSIRDIGEATLGEKGMDALAHANNDECFVAVQEAVDPVNLTAFSNITGELIFQGIVEKYKAPEFIGDELVSAETSRSDNTRLRGLSAISDDALVVKEGEEFPDTQFGEDWIDVPKSEKRGRKIGVTREMVFFDQTGDLMALAGGLGERLGTNREKRILRTVLGIDNTFKRKGVARDTYVPVASDTLRPNQLGGVELLDWKQLDQMWQMFNDMKDDREIPEPIMVQPDTLLVTQYKFMTAQVILSASTIRTETQSGALQTYAQNPLGRGGSMRLMTSPWITALLVEAGLSAANAKDFWHAGQFKKAFRYRTLFPLQVRAAKHDKDDFERDVVMQYRADERGVAYTVAPWYVIQFYKANT